MENDYLQEEENLTDILRDIDKDFETEHGHDVFNSTNITAYDIIARICRLEYSHRNVYKSTETNQTYMLTKFGFRPSTVYNRGLEIASLRRKLEIQEIYNSYQNERLRHYQKLLKEKAEISSKEVINDLKEEIEKLISTNKLLLGREIQYKQFLKDKDIIIEDLDRELNQNVKRKNVQKLKVAIREYE